MPDAGEQVSAGAGVPGGLAEVRAERAALREKEGKWGGLTPIAMFEGLDAVLMDDQDYH